MTSLNKPIIKSNVEFEAQFLLLIITISDEVTIFKIGWIMHPCHQEPSSSLMSSWELTQVSPV